MKKWDELKQAIETITALAKEQGLDPYSMRYEMCLPEALYSIAAYGMPNRFSHWSFGQTYKKMKEEYDNGLSKIYEMVINTNPSYAFLLDSNTLIQNKMIVAHVLAHADFFKNNFHFEKTRKNMHHVMRNHTERLEEIEKKSDKKLFEETIHLALSIQEHTKLMQFIIDSADTFEEWQKEVFEIIKNEYLYFVPQMETKIINEGWATFWHLRLLRELDLDIDEIVEYSTLHAGVIQPQIDSVNPYLLGLKIFESIEKEYGMEQLFDAREWENDASFIDKYLTEDIANELNLFYYKFQGTENKKAIVQSTHFEEVKSLLVDSYKERGVPSLYPYYDKENDQFIIEHNYSDKMLEYKEMEIVLLEIGKLCKKTVVLTTMLDHKKVAFTYKEREGISRKYI